MRLDSLKQNIALTKNICREIISICSFGGNNVGGLVSGKFAGFSSVARSILSQNNLPRYLRTYRFSLKTTLIRLSNLVSELKGKSESIKIRVITFIFGKRFRTSEFVIKMEIKGLCRRIQSVCQRYINVTRKALSKLR